MFGSALHVTAGHGGSRRFGQVLFGARRAAASGVFATTNSHTGVRFSVRRRRRLERARPLSRSARCNSTTCWTHFPGKSATDIPDTKQPARFHRNCVPFQIISPGGKHQNKSVARCRQRGPRSKADAAPCTFLSSISVLHGVHNGDERIDLDGPWPLRNRRPVAPLADCFFRGKVKQADRQAMICSD